MSEMELIMIQVFANREVNPSSFYAGVGGEGRAQRVIVEMPDAFKEGFELSVEYEQNGETKSLLLADHTFLIPTSMVNEEGMHKIQFVAKNQDDGTIFKSKSFYYIVTEALSDEGDNPCTDLTELQRNISSVIKELSEERTARKAAQTESVLRDGELQTSINDTNTRLDYEATAIKGSVTNLSVTAQNLQNQITVNSNAIQMEVGIRTQEIAEIDNSLDVLTAKINGKTTGYVFDTEADLFATLEEENFKAKLKIGDNLYIRDLNVPDYWWDGVLAQRLETVKANLSNYYVKSETDSKDTTVLNSAKAYADDKTAAEKAERISADNALQAGIDKKTDKPLETVSPMTAISITLDPNTVYKYGTLTSLTILGYSTSIYESVIYFTSGTTATVLNLPPALQVSKIGDIIINAGKQYVLSVQNGIMICGEVG